MRISKHLFIMIFMVISMNVFSQKTNTVRRVPQKKIAVRKEESKPSKPNREETERWIESKIKLYGQLKELKIEVSFTEEDMIVRKELQVSGISSILYFIVPIKDIESFGYSQPEKRTCYWLKFNMKKGRKLAVMYSKLGGKPDEYNDDFTIELSTSIEDENMKGRMKEAFTRLLEIHGTLIKKEPF